MDLDGNYFKYFPNEIILEIFERLDPETFIKMTLVSKEMREFSKRWVGVCLLAY